MAVTSLDEVPHKEVLSNRPTRLQQSCGFFTRKEQFDYHLISLYNKGSHLSAPQARLERPWKFDLYGEIFYPHMSVVCQRIHLQFIEMGGLE
jgi:hypothetical protein